MKDDVEQSKPSVQNIQNEFDNHDSRSLTQKNLSSISNSRVVKQKLNQNEEWENITTTTKKLNKITIKRKLTEETTRNKTKKKKRKSEKSLEERQFADHRSIAQMKCKLERKLSKK